MPLVKANCVKKKRTHFLPSTNTALLMCLLFLSFPLRSFPPLYTGGLRDTVSPNPRATGWFALHAAWSLLPRFNNPKMQPHRHQSTKHPESPGTNPLQGHQGVRSSSSPNKIDVTKQVTQGLLTSLSSQDAPKNPRPGGTGLRLKLRPHHRP